MIFRPVLPFGGRSCGGSGLAVDGAAKIAWRGERPFLSTGSHDFGVQTSLQRKLGRQGIYLSASLVRTDGRVLGVPLGSRVVPTLTAAYEVGLTRRTNAILQLYAKTWPTSRTPRTSASR